MMKKCLRIVTREGLESRGFLTRFVYIKDYVFLGKKKQANPMKCGLVVMCHHLMHIPAIVKCEHVFLLFGDKKGVAIDVAFLQFVASSDFAARVWPLV